MYGLVYRSDECATGWSGFLFEGSQVLSAGVLNNLDDFVSVGGFIFVFTELF